VSNHGMPSKSGVRIIQGHCTSVNSIDVELSYLFAADSMGPSLSTFTSTYTRWGKITGPASFKRHNL